jgi:hypothetical protein
MVIRMEHEAYQKGHRFGCIGFGCSCLEGVRDAEAERKAQASQEAEEGILK